MANETIPAGTVARESSLSPWAGEPVTGMIGRGEALSQTPYEAYTGPLTAGPSALQSQAFQGLSSLTLPTGAQTTYDPQMFTAEAAKGYMNPYLMSALQPQIDEARRQAEISRVNQAGRMTRAGAFGGGRQAIMESELGRNLMQNLGNITGQGYKTAFDQAQQQFNTEQQRQMQAARQAQQYGLEGLAAQMGGGATQRDIEQQGITSDIKQFEEERDYPYKQVQFLQSLFQGMPLATTTYQQPEASGLGQFASVFATLTPILKAMGMLPSDK
jgi:hypothetical protein